MYVNNKIIYTALNICFLAFKDFEKPIDWQVNIWELDKENDSNNGFENEDLIVWMRTAALPDFRKLYRRIEHKNEFKNGLPKGNYKLVIKYSMFLVIKKKKYIYIYTSFY